MRTSFAAFVMAAGLVSAVDTPIEGYGVEAMQREVEVFPGQVEVLNGSIQDAHRQAQEINPAFEPQLLSAAPTPTGWRLDKRSDVMCGQFPLASRFRLNAGISHLRGVKGKPVNGPGPGNCGRVSRSYGSGIWWCNDNKPTKTLDSYDAIANSARHIMDKCSQARTYVRGKATQTASSASGPNFELGGWNTIVRGDEEGC